MRTLYEDFKKSDLLFGGFPSIPEYILENLSKELREYQRYALTYYMKSQENELADTQYNHLLFRMATGSGKTVILAAAILYLYKEHGYQNFLFFVHSDAIVKKTYENLLNTNSNKYLFRKEGIIIEGNQVEVKLVEAFPACAEPNTIYLKLATIQKLHSDFNTPTENAITYDYFEDNKVVLLADEAHHLNAHTKKGKLNKSELESLNWEKTVESLLDSNIKNRLLEFTATMDLENPLLFAKYHRKLIFNYDLGRFMDDKYSKNVILLRSDQNDKVKILNGILLSQYRKYIARENNIDLKPIILFKSNKIEISLKAHSTLVDIIQELDVDKLTNHIGEGLKLYSDSELVFNKMFNYYHKVNLENILRDLREDFDEKNILNANNSDFVSLENTVKLNTLEDIYNPIRAIFAVAKLNEGWDVLNLFDIVRISEGASSTIKTTDSEAQLIGRGARYYPFNYEDTIGYKRRFDTVYSPLKVLEQLHYHTINESNYIKNLNKSLKSADITISEEKTTFYTASLKDSFRNSDFYKTGKIYINKFIPTTADNYQRLEDYGVERYYKSKTNSSIEQSLTEFLNNEVQSEKFTEYQVKRVKINPVIWKKAMQKNIFYAYNSLSKYIPNITSINDFINKENYLGTVELEVKMLKGQEFLVPNEALKYAEQYLKYMEPLVKNNFMKPIGTPIFEGKSISSLINDYVVQITNVQSGFSSQKVTRRPMNAKTKGWFVYDNNIGNSLEHQLVDYIGDIMLELKERYSDIYLIRNERKVKFFEFGNTRGFMPDYLLFLKNEGITYQVFLEPKGNRFIEADHWKEKFLHDISFREDVEILGENDRVKLIGIKFFTENSTKLKEFQDDLVQQLNLDIINETEDIQFDDYIEFSGYVDDNDE